MSISADSIDYLFTATAGRTQANMDSLAGTLLGQGIDLFQKGDYNRAINAFRGTASLSPFTDNSAKAYDYMAKAWLNLGKPAEAIKVYQQAIRIYPNDDAFQLALGDIYQKTGDEAEALKSYEAAVRLSPGSADSRYSLGQAYINAGQLNAAREQFVQVARLSPASAAGYYGLGQTARLDKDYPEAVLQLEKAIAVNRNFEKAYIELGFTYADWGDFQKASEQTAELSARGSSQADALGLYIAGAAQPQILYAQGLDGFNTNRGRQTLVSRLSDNLAAANASQLFSMTFAFSKDMDIASVVDTDNWKISRASIRENGGVYNAGLTPPQTEAAILPTPVSVAYDEEENTATIKFRISQNAAANATIDPEHIVFKFYGLDAYGKAMDTSADEFSGFSKVA